MLVVAFVVVADGVLDVVAAVDMVIGCLVFKNQSQSTHVSVHWYDIRDAFYVMFDNAFVLRRCGMMM